ncbi:MAG: ATP-binding protein [Promethearchaeota archaeon]
MVFLNDMKALKKQFSSFSEIEIKKDRFNAIKSIFSRFWNSGDNETGNEITSWDLASEIEKEFNVDLKTSYFGEEIAHPFMVAPGKHTRPGNDDKIRAIKKRVSEGWSGIVLKTAVGSLGGKDVAVEEHFGDVYWPVYKKISRNQFISGERGADLKLDTYISDYMIPSLELGSEHSCLIVPSLICKLPINEFRNEWKYSLQQFYEHSRLVEADISPTISKDLLKCKLKEDVFSTCTSIRDDVINLFKIHEQEFKGKVLIQKMSGQYRMLMSWIIEECKSQFPEKSFNFVMFNREMGTLIIPWNLNVVNSALGGEILYYRNMHTLHAIFSSLENQERVKIAYSGGIDDGIKAFNVIGMSSASSIEVATSLMRMGGKYSLYYLLGGFALYLDWIADIIEKDLGLDIRNLNKLKLLFQDEDLQPYFTKFLGSGKKRHVADIDVRSCTGSCPVPEPLDSTNSCPASLTCPVGAISLVNGQHAIINEDECIGCGNCGESCLRQAIFFKERGI